jgi:hypothetical protein
MAVVASEEGVTAPRPLVPVFTSADATRGTVPIAQVDGRLGLPGSLQQQSLAVLPGGCFSAASLNLSLIATFE